MNPFFFPRRASAGLVAVAVASVLGASLSACVPLALGGMATGVMVAADRRTSGTQLEDEGIELKGASRLRDALGDKAHINLTSYNRQVLITGEVPSEADKARAEDVIKGVENVRSVVNELGVLGHSTLTQRSSDALLTGRVKAALVDSKDVFAKAFKVTTERGTVYLMGRVTQREATRATTIARSVEGVQRVVRMLEIISEEELARLQPPPAPPVKPAE
jgi:osmotically-inducible protein OsmY